MPTTPVVITNVRDTYVAADSAAKNWTTSGLLYMRTGGLGDAFTMVYFSRPVPLGATVLSATLRLYQRDALTAVSRTITAKRITSAWTLERVTYTTRPTVTTAGQVTVTKATATPANTEWAFDVTAQIQAAADGAPWWGIRLEINDTTARRFWSAEGSSTYRPVLEVSWSDAPDAPSQLSPSGNRAVSIAKPTLRFDFTDVAGDTSLQAIQVQINATNVWPAPTFDSGTVATSEPQLDLNATAYAGLAAGSSAWWRVRVQDGAGLWSAWSPGAQFQRVNRGTLTITNPAASPNNFVEEPTPPISWTYTGATQTAYQVVITDGADPTQWLWTTGKLTGTTNTVTIPQLPPGDALFTPGGAYRVYVAVWDSVARESTPGDPIWTRVFRDFTYQTTNTVTPVAALTMTPQAPYPWAQLQWTRATAPDSFSVVRTDNVAGVSRVTATNLVPADLLVSGTTYRYVDRDASPRRSTTWQVLAVVNGKTSAPNPTVDGQTKPEGIWVSDTGRNINVQVLGRGGQASVDIEMPDKGENLDVVGASTPVRITQALQGYSGHVAGCLVTTSVQDAQAARQAMFELKRYPTRRVFLTLGDITMLASIYNISVTPTANREIDFDVEFDFFQHGAPFKSVL